MKIDNKPARIVNKTMQNLFSYGTLQHPEVQKDLFRRILQGSPDRLRGYRTETIEILDESFHSKSEQESYLIAVPSDDESDTIEGTVFEISNDELFIADRYESDDYKRIMVQLDSGKKAWVYVASKKDR
jgi:gamma-glutamylcyclotransferase (GGCT)/AIG2-like uncharacterized protein YtfP